MGAMIYHSKCGCSIIQPDNRFEKITLSLGQECPSRDEDPNNEHQPRAKCIELAAARDKRNAESVAKAKATRAKNKALKGA